MSIHQLTAGDGYSYLTRQVASMGVTDRGHTGLSDYYSQVGESPGQWLGSTLADVAMAVGEEVTSDQMASLLFGDGRQSNADQIGAQILRERTAGSIESADAGATPASTARDAHPERFGLSPASDFDSDGLRKDNRVDSPIQARPRRRRYRGWVLASGGRR